MNISVKELNTLVKNKLEEVDKMGDKFVKIIYDLIKDTIALGDFEIKEYSQPMPGTSIITATTPLKKIKYIELTIPESLYINKKDNKLKEFFNDKQVIKDVYVKFLKEIISIEINNKNIIKVKWTYED